jgi:ankyrin repeat protein
MEQLRSEYNTEQKSLLHVLVENGLSRMFISPLPVGGQSIEGMYASFYHSKLILSLSELVLPNEAINARDDRDQTPLHYAAREGELQVVEWLIEKEAEVDAKDSQDGRTPLSCAAGNGHLEVVKSLLDKGAEVDSKDNWGRTPLIYTAANGHLEMVRLLVATGKAEVDSRDIASLFSPGGWTPLSLAAYYGHLEVVRLLVATGKAEVDSKDLSQRTPLSYAAANGHLEVVKFLVQEAKADIRSKDDGGKTALDLANDGAERGWRGFKEVV